MNEHWKNTSPEWRGTVWAYSGSDASIDARAVHSKGCVNGTTFASSSARGGKRTIKLATGRRANAKLSLMSQSNEWRDDAERFRRLARVVDDERNRLQLLQMARELDERADRLEQAGQAPEADH